MSSAELLRVRERSKSKKRLNEIYGNSINAYIVHYSCESFYPIPGQPAVGASTRVTSIVIRNIKSAQSKMWSIHKSAELNSQLPLLNSIKSGTLSAVQIKSILDPLEKDMLDGFYNFISARNDETVYVHWNMRDDNYGFSALEHRHSILGGVHGNSVIDDKQKFDLARELVVMYGRNYAPHLDSGGRKGRIMSLIEMNKISDMDALTGEEEAAAFLNGDYLALQKSNLRKVDMFSTIFDSAHANKLKTYSSLIDRYGVHPVALIEIIKEKPIVSAILALGALGAGVANWTKIISLF